MYVDTVSGMSTGVDTRLVAKNPFVEAVSKMSTRVDCNSTELPIQVESVRKISTEADMKYCPALSSLELLAKCLLR